MNCLNYDLFNDDDDNNYYLYIYLYKLLNNIKYINIKLRKINLNKNKLLFHKSNYQK